MPRRSQSWIWAGRISFAALTTGLVVYLSLAGLERADKVASCIGAFAAILSLAAPYLLPESATGPTSDRDWVERTGTAESTEGGRATTGADIAGESRAVTVLYSGDASASGLDSVATSGILRRPGP
jgi:hypothetical protein